MTERIYIAIRETEGWDWQRKECIATSTNEELLMALCEELAKTVDMELENHEWITDVNYYIVSAPFISQWSEAMSIVENLKEDIDA